MVGVFRQKFPALGSFGSLKSLRLPDDFNDSLAGIKLPEGLESLHFGWDFNQRLEGLTWPPLQELGLGMRFNQGWEGLPNTLKSLSFGESFNQSFLARAKRHFFFWAILGLLQKTPSVGIILSLFPCLANLRFGSE